MHFRLKIPFIRLRRGCILKPVFTAMQLDSDYICEGSTVALFFYRSFNLKKFFSIIWKSLLNVHYYKLLPSYNIEW